MEMFELRYFLGVASQENIHRASEKLHVSPASLSKAITRLEDQLSVKLFSRDGRNIKLTDHGKLLQKRASEIIRLEESANLELSGHHGTIHVVIAGSEILISQMAIKFSQQILKKYPLAHFEYIPTNDETALEFVRTGQAHFALVTEDDINSSEFSSKIITKTKFQTVVGIDHPLYSIAKTKKQILIDEILKYPFVSPSSPLLGKVGIKQSHDGWRDDKFARKIIYQTSSLKTLEEILIQGKALAYLPDYFTEKLKLETLLISNCPYTCNQNIKIVIRNSKNIGWINQVF